MIWMGRINEDGQDVFLLLTPYLAPGVPPGD